MEIGVQTVNAANITAGGGEKGSEMILAAIAPNPAGLLLLIFAFAAYDRQEEVEHGVWEERDREFDLPGD